MTGLLYILQNNFGIEEFACGQGPSSHARHQKLCLKHLAYKKLIGGVHLL